MAAATWPPTPTTRPRWSTSSPPAPCAAHSRWWSGRSGKAARPPRLWTAILPPLMSPRHRGIGRWHKQQYAAFFSVQTALPAHRYAGEGEYRQAGDRLAEAAGRLEAAP